MGEGWVGVYSLSLGEELGWAPTPPAPFAKPTAFTPSQPSPIEGEGSGSSQASFPNTRSNTVSTCLKW